MDINWENIGYLSFIDTGGSPRGIRHVGKAGKIVQRTPARLGVADPDGVGVDYQSVWPVIPSVVDETIGLISVLERIVVYAGDLDLPERRADLVAGAVAGAQIRVVGSRLDDRG